MNLFLDSPRKGDEILEQDEAIIFDDLTADSKLLEESYYVNREVFSRLKPSDIPQPRGKIYRG